MEHDIGAACLRPLPLYVRVTSFGAHVTVVCFVLLSRCAPAVTMPNIARADAALSVDKVAQPDVVASIGAAFLRPLRDETHRLERVRPSCDYLY